MIQFIKVFKTGDTLFGQIWSKNPIWVGFLGVRFVVVVVAGRGDFKFGTYLSENIPFSTKTPKFC